MVKGNKITRKRTNKRNKKKVAKKDRIHGTKKGEKGEAAQYVTRAQALAKLQLSLADFRRLCILKGIYPRDPKKKNQGQDKTYYHVKDVRFLQSEPLLQKFFDIQAAMKKVARRVARGERDLAKNSEKHLPKYTLSHLVRERYPSFEDALRDLDDALSMLALFQALPGDQERGIPAGDISEATRLYQEFQLYVVRAQALRKVFASVKGYYFQADIMGHTVTWLVPHQFAHTLPEEVDFRVMLTFLEFYRSLVKFVNFRLFQDLGLAYPPKRDQARQDACGDLAALDGGLMDASARKREERRKLQESEDAEVATSAAADFAGEEGGQLSRNLAVSARMKTAFQGLRVFISREVPMRPIYFTLLCGGAAEVGWERGASKPGEAGPGSAFPPTSDKITHHVVDRPLEAQAAACDGLPEGREFVQPQWVLDSFNLGCLLPIAPYAPGQKPPPHLSPFVDDTAEGYVPRQREILDRFAAEAVGTVVPEPEAAAETKEGEGEEAADKDEAATVAEAGAKAFAEFSAELKAEKAGIWHSAGGKAAAAAMLKEAAAEAPEAPKKPSESEEATMRARAVMAPKHKRLLKKIEHGQALKSEALDRLNKKRKKLDNPEKEGQGEGEGDGLEEA